MLPLVAKLEVGDCRPAFRATKALTVAKLGFRFCAYRFQKGGGVFVESGSARRAS
jgi:hypothetical protein